MKWMPLGYALSTGETDDAVDATPQQARATSASDPSVYGQGAVQSADAPAYSDDVTDATGTGPELPAHLQGTPRGTFDPSKHHVQYSTSQPPSTPTSPSPSGGWLAKLTPYRKYFPLALILVLGGLAFWWQTSGRAQR